MKTAKASIFTCHWCSWSREF